MHENSDFIIVSSPVPTEFSSIISGNDAITLLEFIHHSLSCDTEEDFASLFPKIQKLFPFDFAHAFLGYHDSTKGIVMVDRVNISFPEEWLSEFMSRNYLQADVVVRENFRHHRLQYWADAKKTYEIKSLCNDFGMREGYSHGSRPTPPGKHGSMFSFSGPSMECGVRTEIILETVTPLLHLALTHMFGKKQSSHINKSAVSTREKEVLNWLKQGKSSWDISIILSISERTVNFHVSNIMKKLGASNRPHAVAVAAHLGLVDID
jgi:DNA-binding CsgD family transcriptional regulator